MRPKPPRGYKYNPVTLRLEKLQKPVKTLGRAVRKRRRRRKRGGNLSSVKKIHSLVKKLTRSCSLITSPLEVFIIKTLFLALASNFLFIKRVVSWLT